MDLLRKMMEVQEAEGAVTDEALRRLAILCGADEDARKGAAALQPVADLMSRYPMGFGHWLCVLDFHLSTPKEIAVACAMVKEELGP